MHARGAADDDDPRRHVLRHDRAGADEGLLADLDAGAEDRAAADARAAADRRPLDQRVALRSVRPMKLSFVVTTQGAMKTSSSRVEYAVM